MFLKHRIQHFKPAWPMGGGWELQFSNIWRRTCCLPSRACCPNILILGRNTFLIKKYFFKIRGHPMKKFGGIDQKKYIPQLSFCKIWCHKLSWDLIQMDLKLKLDKYVKGNTPIFKQSLQIFWLAALRHKMNQVGWQNS